MQWFYRVFGKTPASALLLGLSWAASFSMDAQAADRYFSKPAAAKMAAQMATALPPAPAGWKTAETKSAAAAPMVLPGRKVRKGFAPSVYRRYVPVSGGQGFSLSINYGAAADLDHLDGRYRAAVPRWPTARIDVVDGWSIYILPTVSHVTYYSRAGSFAIAGRVTGKRLDEAFILALLRQVDVVKLKAAIKQTGK